MVRPSGRSVNRNGPAIVEEIPDRADNGFPGAPPSPLDVIFSYRLLTPAFAGTSADLGRQELSRFMTDLLTKWADSHNSIVL